MEEAIQHVLEAGENIFEWIWDGLPPAERVIFSAVAEGTDERTILKEENLVEILQKHGIRILTRELELAPAALVNWEMFKKVEGGYAFFIELMRRWVASRKPLPKVKDELDRIVPFAETLYQGGYGYYRQNMPDQAQTQLRDALKINPNHLKARLLLGQILYEQDKLDEAIKELEEAYRYDEDATRNSLIRVLLAKGESFQDIHAEDIALKLYKRILDLSPNEKVARERRTAIWLKRGDRALNANDLDAALEAYKRTGIQEKIAEVEEIKLNQALEKAEKDAKELEKKEEWDKIIEILQFLVEKTKDNTKWQEELKRVKKEKELGQRYNEGMGSFQQGRWTQAMRLLADVVYENPDYKDSAEILAKSVKENRNKTVQKQTEEKRSDNIAADNTIQQNHPFTRIFDVTRNDKAEDHKKQETKVKSKQQRVDSDKQETQHKPNPDRSRLDKVIYAIELVTFSIIVFVLLFIILIQIFSK